MSYFTSDLRSFGRSAQVVDELAEFGLTLPDELTGPHQAAARLRSQLEEHRRTRPPGPDDLVTALVGEDDPSTVLASVTDAAMGAEAHRKADELLNAARERAEAQTTAAVRRLGPETLVKALQPLHHEAAAELAALHEAHPGVGDLTAEDALAGPNDRRQAFMRWRETGARLTALENLAIELRQTPAMDDNAEVWWDDLSVRMWRRLTWQSNPAGGAIPEPPTYSEMLTSGARRVLLTASEARAAVKREKARQSDVVAMRPKDRDAVLRGEADADYPNTAA